MEASDWGPTVDREQGLVAVPGPGYVGGHALVAALVLSPGPAGGGHDNMGWGTILGYHQARTLQPNSLMLLITN